MKANVASTLLLAEPVPMVAAMALRSRWRAQSEMSADSHPYRAAGRMEQRMTNSLSALEMGTKASLRTALMAL